MNMDKEMMEKFIKEFNCFRILKTLPEVKYQISTRKSPSWWKWIEGKMIEDWDVLINALNETFEDEGIVEKAYSIMVSIDLPVMQKQSKPSQSRGSIQRKTKMTVREKVKKEECKNTIVFIVEQMLIGAMSGYLGNSEVLDKYTDKRSAKYEAIHQEILKELEDEGVIADDVSNKPEQLSDTLKNNDVKKMRKHPKNKKGAEKKSYGTRFQHQWMKKENEQSVRPKRRK